jgi:hypothetical protein
MSYIRNLIHHPENQHDLPFSPEELKDSMEKMLILIKRLTKP